jgi:hypothetical protein
MLRGLSAFEKKRIADALPLRKGVALETVLASIESAMCQFRQAMNAQSERRYKEVEILEDEIRLKVNSYDVKGRPRKDEMRSYVTALVNLYEQATGKRIGRSVDAYALGHREKPHPFLLACIRPTSAAYPRRIVREVLEAQRETRQHDI